MVTAGDRFGDELAAAWRQRFTGAGHKGREELAAHGFRATPGGVVLPDVASFLFLRLAQSTGTRATGSLDLLAVARLVAGLDRVGADLDRSDVAFVVGLADVGGAVIASGVTGVVEHLACVLELRQSHT